MLRLFVFLIISSLFFSCKKHRGEDPKPETYPSYFNFKPGNYWVYRIFEFDETGKETSTDEYDSLWVEKDTVIRGSTYHMLIDSDYGYKYWRDSLHYIVDHLGERIFSSRDFLSIFSSYYQLFGKDTAYRRDIKMEETEEITSTPAGRFKTRAMVAQFYFYPGYSSPGSVDHSYTRYAENIGPVLQTYAFTFNSAAYSERRLIRFHIE